MQFTHCFYISSLVYFMVLIIHCLSYCQPVYLHISVCFIIVIVVCY